MLPEFSRHQMLTDPPQAGVEDRLEASPAECAALAERFGIEALAHFSARFTRKPYPGGGVMITGRFNSPQLAHSWWAELESASWLRRLPRREGEVFFFGTAMAPGLFHSSEIVDLNRGGRIASPWQGRKHGAGSALAAT